MVKQYRQKVYTFPAIEFTDAPAQAAEVANYLGAQSFSVDVASNTASFTVDDTTHKVKVGQVVARDGETVTITDSKAFYSQYEQV